jgi:hypothetical protein
MLVGHRHAVGHDDEATGFHRAHRRRAFITWPPARAATGASRR